ncbi:MAG: hypothetical protein WC702_03965 [Patescibacteria group bacterium]
MEKKLTIGLFASAVLIMGFLFFLANKTNIVESNSAECSENQKTLIINSTNTLRFPAQFGWEGHTVLIRNQADQPIDSMYPNQICDTDEEGILEKITSVKFNGLKIIDEIWIKE